MLKKPDFQQQSFNKIQLFFVNDKYFEENERFLVEKLQVD